MWDPDWADSPGGGPYLRTIHAQRGHCQALDGAPAGHKSPPVHRWPRDRAAGSGHGIGSAPGCGTTCAQGVPLGEPVELGDRLRAGHDRRRRLVLDPQVAAERGEVGGIVRLGCRINWRGFVSLS